MQIKEAQYKGFMYFKTSTFSNSLQEDKKKNALNVLLKVFQSSQDHI